MTQQDYSENDWNTEPRPWWVTPGWFLYLTLSMYCLLWLASAAWDHTECWNSDFSTGCAVVWVEDVE